MGATAYIAARVEPELAAEFKRVYEAIDRLVSNELRRLIRRRIAENNEAPDPQSRTLQSRVEREPAHDSG